MKAMKHVLSLLLTLSMIFLPACGTRLLLPLLQAPCLRPPLPPNQRRLPAQRPPPHPVVCWTEPAKPLT